MADIGVLAQIPGMAGYLQQKAMNEGQTSQNLQQATGAMGILSQIAAQQKAQQDAIQKQKDLARQAQYRAAIAALGPNATQEQLAATSAQFVDNPEKMMTVQQSSLDRAATRDAAETTAKATREATAANQQANRDAAMERQKERIEAGIEQARQRGVDQETLRRMTIAGQETMVRLAASLRPAPQVQPLVSIVGPDGKQILVERKDAVGKMPAGAGSKAELVAAGKSDVDKDIITLKSALDTLNEGGGITSTDKGVIPNIGSWVSNTGVGQILGSMGGTYNQKARDVISQARPLLLRSIMQSSGMSAKQLDSNAELKLWLSTATDSTKGYEANVEALNNIAEKYGSGAIVDNGRIAKGAIKPSRRSDDVPAGIDAKVWGALTPEEKKLFK